MTDVVPILPYDLLTTNILFNLCIYRIELSDSNTCLEVPHIRAKWVIDAYAMPIGFHTGQVKRIT